MDRKSNKEYIRQIKKANDEVISCLKSYIADQGLPQIDIFNAIISSVSRKNSVEIKDMYTLNIFCEELIREVISDVYVSNDKKREYTLALAAYIGVLNITSEDNPISTVNNIDYKKYRQKINTKSSVLISIISALLTMIPIIVSSGVLDNVYNILRNLYVEGFLRVIVLCSMCTSVAMVTKVIVKNA